GYGGDYNERAPEVTKEHKYHQSRQASAQEAFIDQSPESIHYVPRLVEHQIDLYVFRGSIAHAWERLADVLNDTESGCIGALGYRDIHGASAIHMGIAHDNVRAVRDGPNIPQINGWAGPPAKWRVQKFVDVGAERRIGRYKPNEVTCSYASRWKDRRRPVDSCDHFFR